MDLNTGKTHQLQFGSLKTFFTLTIFGQKNQKTHKVPSTHQLHFKSSHPPATTYADCHTMTSARGPSARCDNLQEKASRDERKEVVFYV